MRKIRENKIHPENKTAGRSPAGLFIRQPRRDATRSAAAMAAALFLPFAISAADPVTRFTFESVALPGARQTLLTDITNDGKLVGRFRDAEGRSHGFVQAGADLVTFNVTGTTDTFATGIDSSERVAGTPGTASQSRIQSPSQRALTFM